MAPTQSWTKSGAYSYRFSLVSMVVLVAAFHCPDRISACGVGRRRMALPCRYGGPDNGTTAAPKNDLDQRAAVALECPPYLMSLTELLRPMEVALN